MIEVSNGEILDRWTILALKAHYLKDTQARINVAYEIATLAESRNKLVEASNILELEDNLYGVNNKLWIVEDRLRVKERLFEFDAEFVNLARSVYLMNDERAEIKKKINDITKSNIVEEKSYEPY